MVVESIVSKRGAQSRGETGTYFCPCKKRESLPHQYRFNHSFRCHRAMIKDNNIHKVIFKMHLRMCCPIVKVVEDNIGIKRCFFTMIISSQKLVDEKKVYAWFGQQLTSFLLRPEQLAAVEAKPELRGKVQRGSAFRVPSPMKKQRKLTSPNSTASDA